MGPPPAEPPAFEIHVQQFGYKTRVLTIVPDEYGRPREQAVKEVLQLRLYQAIVDVKPVPPNATIVLATGDGSPGPFYEKGFPSSVEFALKRGWRVELYVWKRGPSESWNELKRRCEHPEYQNGKFSIHRSAPGLPFFSRFVAGSLFPAPALSKLFVSVSSVV